MRGESEGAASFEQFCLQETRSWGIKGTPNLVWECFGGYPGRAPAFLVVADVVDDEDDDDEDDAGGGDGGGG